jgi:predicted anti-sigma-YlaC factor YlaD
MDCRKVSRLLSEFADGVLNEKQAQRVQQHVSQCQECAAVYRKLDCLRQTLSEQPAFVPPDDFAQVVMRRVRAEAKLPLSVPRIAPWKFAVAAAAVFLVAILAIAQLRGDGRTRRTTERTTVAEIDPEGAELYQVFVELLAEAGSDSEYNGYWDAILTETEPSLLEEMETIEFVVDDLPTEGKEYLRDMLLEYMDSSDDAAIG